MTKTALSLLFCATLLTACANPPIEVRTERIAIPASLLVCPEMPKPPDEVRSQRDVALYLVDLREYGRACEAKLQAVRDFQESFLADPVTTR